MESLRSVITPFWASHTSVATPGGRFAAYVQCNRRFFLGCSNISRMNDHRAAFLFDVAGADAGLGKGQRSVCNDCQAVARSITGKVSRFISEAFDHTVRAWCTDVCHSLARKIVLASQRARFPRRCSLAGVRKTLIFA